MRENTTFYCKNSAGGSLERGLKISLNTIYQNLIIEKAINNFTVRTQWPYLQAEGAFVVWNTTDLLTYTLKSAIQDVTSTWLEMIKVIIFVIFQILCTTCIVFQICVIFLIIFVGVKNQINKYHTIKKIIHLLPPSIVYSDDNFDRHLKFIASRDRMI